MENIKDPLYRYFEREVNSGAKLLQDVIHDLEDVVLICQVGKHETHLENRKKKNSDDTSAKIVDNFKMFT